MASPPSAVAVVGAGTMGAGMASVFALAGCEVRVAARRTASLERARDRAGAVLGALAPEAADAALARLAFTTDAGAALAGAGLVVETIVEEIEPKREVLELAERVAAPDAILVSNTSSLPLAALAAPLAQPERFAGFHWFNPPELVELVEVVGTDATDPRVLESLVGIARALGKAPVLVRRAVPGFLANRLQYALLREAWALVADGVCAYEDVDRALTHGLGARWAAIGPFETMDLGGLEVFRAVAENLMPELSTATAPPAFLRDAVDRGALGVKSGKGLRGSYGPEALAEILARRERVLRGLPALRDGVTGGA